MTIVMNMSGYEIEHEEVVAQEYGGDARYAELIPQLQSVSDSRAPEAGTRTGLPAELANVDVDAFLKEMDKYQR
ncbi:MAG: hypothetical protein WAW02_12545 [Sideroxyarcus sp.]